MSGDNEEGKCILVTSKRYSSMHLINGALILFGFGYEEPLTSLLNSRRKLDGIKCSKIQ